MCAMDTKLNPTRLPSDLHVQSALKKKPTLSYIQGIKAELKKVSWTTKEELILSTKVVIAVTFVCGVGIYFVDLLVKGGLNFISYVTHKLLG
ncbi:Protein translocase subunit SecE [Candidatus Rhabdochlamydia oedothoracis]|uniref:Protein translocase subunit SecE n=2 Tax=Candidatus Rhabdochlamydiaceae TaxID=689704 RepID=A0ABX8V080_9BACT|nr:Protein translocase subunit SecE [Candidatus Rhabdochlamydia sp. W815]MCL6755736.1 preprotein translocase subunit SecE [Candidatus Rhabdochlamydia oedothoracis]QYF48618.1 Protein translocase subunit SecE [Candidatus Rhabdochlamydia oedothoracis]